MKRREFLGTVAAGMAVVAVPVVGSSQIEQFGSEAVRRFQMAVADSREHVLLAMVGKASQSQVCGIVIAAAKERRVPPDMPFEINAWQDAPGSDLRVQITLRDDRGNTLSEDAFGWTARQIEEMQQPR